MRTLPTPDEPATSSTPCSSSARKAPDSSCSRPKYRSASATPAGGRPKYGHSGLSARNTRSERSGDPGGGSPAPIRRAPRRGPVRARRRAAPAPGARWRARPLADPAATRHAQHDPTPLTQRRLGHAGARQRGDLLNLTRLQPCVQKQLLDTETHLLETAGGDLSRLPVGEFDGGLAPPQRERLRERVRGTFGLTQLQLLRTPLDESLEPLRVDLDVLRDQSVPERGGFDLGRRDKPAQPHNAPWNDMRPRRGRAVTPQRRREGCSDNGAPRRTVSAAITARSRGASGIRPSSSVSAPRTRTSIAPL